MKKIILLSFLSLWTLACEQNQEYRPYQAVPSGKGETCIKSEARLELERSYNRIQEELLQFNSAKLLNAGSLILLNEKLSFVKRVIPNIGSTFIYYDFKAGLRFVAGFNDSPFGCQDAIQLLSEPFPAAQQEETLARLATARSIPEAEVNNCWRIDFDDKLVLYFANGERYEYILPIDSDDSCLNNDLDPAALSQVRFLKPSPL